MLGSYSAKEKFFIGLPSCLDSSEGKAYFFGGWDWSSIVDREIGRKWGGGLKETMCSNYGLCY